MSPGEASLVSELATVKKSLSKTCLNALAKSDVLVDAIRLCTQKTLPEYHSDQLALILVLFKQLRQAIPTTSTADQPAFFDFIRNAINPAVQSGGVIADLLVINLEHTMKANQIRAVECAHALARLVSTLSPIAGDILSVQSLFDSTCRSAMINKPDLLLSSNLLEAIPTEAIPEDLLPRMLDGLKLPDSGSIRTSIIIDILEKRRSAPTPITDPEIIDLILPLLTSTASSAIINNLNRYLLPSLFKSFPSSLHTLLSSLASTTGSEEDDTFPSWVSIASLGVSLGILTIDQLPTEDLSDALGHEDAAVRLKAYDAITGCKDSGQLISEGVMSLVKEALRVNAVLPGSSARSDFASATHVFFTNLRQAGTFARRRQRKPNADTSPNSTEAKSLVILSDFHNWFINEFIDPALVSSRRIPVYRPLFALQLLDVYVGVFGDDSIVMEAVYTERMIKLLIGCQGSEFTELRGRARTILKSAPTPLPGYPAIDSPNAKALLQSAYQSFSNPRRTQNDAAVAGLCILFEKVLLPTDTNGDGTSVKFVDGLIDKLEAELKRGEEGIKVGMDDLALHGLLAAAKALISCVDLKESPAQQIWKAPLHRLTALISRVWQLTRTIMSLSTTQEDSSAVDSAPAHEIAKAYQLLSNGQNENEEGEVDTRKILSACWRATKEASDLLSLIISQPILQAGDTQTVWSKEEVHDAGKQYLQWMHEIRHRGTFSKVALAFASLVDAVKTAPSLKDLAQRWLELELEAITDDNISITRRSAALPYSLLSIVAGDQILLDQAIGRLIDLARLDNTSTSDITRVHCFNILKIVLLDARQTKLFNNYFEKTVMTAVAAFSSPNWNVRNVGLILFSTLVHRSLTPSRGSPDAHASRITLAGRQTFAAWHAKHPTLLPYIIQYMEEHLPTSTKDGSTGHTPLFPMLIIIRSLRWSEKGEEVQEGLKGVVRPHLASKERQVREVAAQALSSLVSSSEALTEMNNWSSVNSSDYNAIHGRLVYIRNLISGVIDWSDSSANSREIVESVLRSKHEAFSELPCPPIQTEIFLAIDRYFVNANPTDLSLDWAVVAAQNVIDGPRSLLPGNDALLAAAADLILSHRPSTQTALSLLSNPTEVGRLGILERITKLPPSISGEILHQILDVAIDRKNGEAVQIAALDAITSSSLGSAVLEGLSAEKRSAKSDLLVGLLESKCVPLKEAALPAAAWAISGLPRDSGMEGKNDMMGRLAREILDASAETQSQPRRETAIKSLLHLRSYLFPTTSQSTIDSNTLLLLHQTLLRSLQDDDEDVRLIAADLIKDGLGMRRALTQARAVDAWWSWLGGLIKTIEMKTPWISWLQDLAANRLEIEEDLAVLQPQQIDNRAFTSADLFAEEKPNLFRDPLDDARHASTLLVNLYREGVNVSDVDERAVREIQLVRDHLIEAEKREAEISPIDEAFRVVGILPSYLEVLDRAFM